MSAYVEQLEQQSILDLKGTIIELQKLKSGRFSGEVKIRSADRKYCFSFVMRLGRISWASSNVDPQRYWQRWLHSETLEVPQEWLRSVSDEQKPGECSTELAELMIEGSVNRHQLTEALTNVSEEVFFDLIQISKAYSDSFTTEAIGQQQISDGGLDIDAEASRSSIVLPMLETDALLKIAIQKWQDWQTKCSVNLSPNLFPVVQDYQVLSGLPAESTEKRILSQINGTQTIRDLAGQNNYPVVNLAQALLFHLQSGTINFSKTARQITVPTAPIIPKKGITVACIDDSPLVYQSLKQILENNGYDCYGVQEPLTIMPRLIKQKPDFIFLDLLMPIVNGYEVCGQIRKTPSLKDIPVVILTGKDGLVDRMRSKMVGATDFMSKPVSNDAVLKILEKHLTIRN
jgi:two-component system, chemotaxis family, response regulator PixG